MELHVRRRLLLEQGAVGATQLDLQVGVVGVDPTLGQALAGEHALVVREDLLAVDEDLGEVGEQGLGAQLEEAVGPGALRLERGSRRPVVRRLDSSHAGSSDAT